MPVPLGIFHQIRLTEPIVEQAQPMEERQFSNGERFLIQRGAPILMFFPTGTIFNKIIASPSIHGEPPFPMYGTSEPIAGVRYEVMLGTDNNFANRKNIVAQFPPTRFKGYFLGGRRSSRITRKKEKKAKKTKKAKKAKKTRNLKTQ